MRKDFLLLVIGVLLGLNMNAQINLIPTPQQIEYKNSHFTISTKTKIVNRNVGSFYVNELMGCIEQELGLTLKPAKRGKKNSIELIRVKKEWRVSLKENNLYESFDPGAEGYVLDISSKSVKILAQSDAGIFYGIQTLKQIIAANRIRNTIPGLVIYDYPDIPVRAWQDDISRGPIPTMELLKEQVRNMASFKLNYFHLYIEHIFRLDKHPGIAPEDGITKAQIEELSKYAKKYHVKLIGSYQSFGHMAKTLSHPNYRHLAENNHIISPALSESYHFLDDVYQEIVPVFDSEYFNINCDETFGLGEGKSKAMVDSLGIDGVYTYHINKLNDMLKRYDKKILMWGDIVSNYPSSVEQLPKDITVMAWGYHAAESFEYAITPISTKGLNFWVAPGISCWSNIFPNFHQTEINVYNFIRDGHKNNTTGVLITSWDDDGLNFFHNNWHGLVWGGENSWKAPSSPDSPEQSEKGRKALYRSFNKSFNKIFYGLEDGSLTNLIVEFSALHKSGIRDILRNSRFFEPIFPIHLEYITDTKKEANQQLLNQLDSLTCAIRTIAPRVEKNNIAIDYLEFAIRQVQFTLKKNLLRINLYRYINSNGEYSVANLKTRISELIEELEKLKSDYGILWNKENRPHWLDINLNRYDDLKIELANLEGYCIITPSEKLTAHGREIQMRSLFGDLPVHYTINEDTVNASSKRYDGSLFIKDDASIKARVVSDQKFYNISECNLIHHKGIGKLHKLHSTFSTYNPGYDGGGINALLDGRHGDPENLRSGRWQGFSGQNIDVEIDLGTKQSISTFSMGFYQNTHSWVIFPQKIEIFVKDIIADEYKLLKTITNTIAPETKGSLKHEYGAEFQDIETRYIRVIAHYYGKLPDWHHAGSNYESMIFADEIIIK